MTMHTLGDVLNALEATPAQRDRLGHLGVDAPELITFAGATRMVKEPNTRAYGRTLTLPVNDVTPFRVLPFDPTRTKAMILLPPATIYPGTLVIGQASEVQAGFGYTLYPGGSLTIEAADDVYCLAFQTGAAAGAVVPISVWTEFSPEA